MTLSVANYITLDSHYYVVLAPDYKRSIEPAKVVQRNVLGNTIVSIGPGYADRNTSSVFYIPFNPASGWGTMADLQAASEKNYVSYTDHVTGGGSEWGGGTYNITIIKVEVIQLRGSPHPYAGYEAYVEWSKVL